MGYSIEVTGLDEAMQKLDKLGKEGQQIVARGLYEGAGVMADKVSREVHGISTEPFHYAAGGQKRKPSPEEKTILENARKGVSKFKKTATRVETHVGIGDGYANITWNHAKSGLRTKYKIGYGGKARQSQSQEGKSSGRSAKPVYVVLNAINSGTSFMQKQPFMRKAFSQGAKQAEEAIEKSVLEQLDKIEL
jgi:HK97 gp10 family phage protein